MFPYRDQPRVPSQSLTACQGPDFRSEPSVPNYLQGTDRHPLGVWGESGSGKSALMAKAIADCESRIADCESVFRFIGATPASSDGRSLIESLCRQITRTYGGDEATIPTDYRELVKEFSDRLKLATPQKPLIVFLDALDQLSDADHARNLIWLPAELPENVRLVVSTLPGECKTAIERKAPSGLVKLEPMPREEADELLKAWLSEAGRTLQPDQRREVLNKFAQCCFSPDGRRFIADGHSGLKVCDVESGDVIATLAEFYSLRMPTNSRARSSANAR